LWIAFNTNSLQPYQRDPFGRLRASHPPTSLLPLPEGDAQLDAPQPARRRGTGTPSGAPGVLVLEVSRGAGGGVPV